MSTPEEEKPRGFAVHDRRSFTDEGSARPEPPAESPAAASPPPSGAGDKPAASPPPSGAGDKPASSAPPSGAARAADAERSRRLPPVDFPTFILSLGSSALMHLGEAPHPGTDETAQDLGMAKHTIDLLSMLQEKTKGNLTPPEAELLENLLFDLRLRYVEAAKK